MRVLVACEESQAVTIELRKLGHEAYSCDIIDCSGGHPEWHIKWDALALINGNCSFITCDGQLHRIDGKWDMILAFPPCTHLAISGAKHFDKKREDGRQREGIEFFCQFLQADCERLAIENPTNIIMGGEYIKQWFPDLAEKYNVPRSPTQKIQPWQFGDPYEKTTCLWLKGLPKLDATNVVGIPERQMLPNGKTMPSWYSKTYSRDNLNGQSRQSMRSKTFPGIAKAMAEQWAGPINNKEE